MQRRGTTPGTVRAKMPHAGARRRVRTVLAKPGVKCSPDLPRGLRRVSESAHNKPQTRRSAPMKVQWSPPAGGTQTTREVRATFVQSSRGALHLRGAFLPERSRGWSPGVARPVSIGPHSGVRSPVIHQFPPLGFDPRRDSIYDKSLTGEPILPSRTANQYLANQPLHRSGYASLGRVCTLRKVPTIRGCLGGLALMI